jgi:hypothetical protein
MANKRKGTMNNLLTRVSFSRPHCDIQRRLCIEMGDLRCSKLLKPQPFPKLREFAKEPASGFKTCISDTS